MRKQLCNDTHVCLTSVYFSLLQVNASSWGNLLEIFPSLRQNIRMLPKRKKTDSFIFKALFLFMKGQGEWNVAAFCSSTLNWLLADRPHKSPRIRGNRLPSRSCGIVLLPVNFANDSHRVCQYHKVRGVNGTSGVWPWCLLELLLMLAQHRDDSVGFHCPQKAFRLFAWKLSLASLRALPWPCPFRKAEITDKAHWNGSPCPEVHLSAMNAPHCESLYVFAALWMFRKRPVCNGKGLSVMELLPYSGGARMEKQEVFQAPVRVGESLTTRCLWRGMGRGEQE